MYDFRYYFTPLSGCFSPFPHGTVSLSVVSLYLALDSGLPGFPQGFTCLVVLRNLLGEKVDFAYGDFTLCVGPSQALRLSISFVTPRPFCKTITQALQHLVCNAYRLTHTRFELFPFRSPLLGESVRFLFLWLLRCFTSPGRLTPPYEFRWELWGFAPYGFPIRTFPYQCLLPAPRNFSQAITSFIAI